MRKSGYSKKIRSLNSVDPSVIYAFDDFSLQLVTGQESQEYVGPIFVISCKSSLRERSGQTMRWKILLDLLKSKCPCIDCPKNKYNLKRIRNRSVFTGLVTADLYDEINNSQQKGLFEFFDFVFVTKYIEKQNSIKPLSKSIIISMIYFHCTQIYESLFAEYT